MTDTTELRELLAKATPRPWEWTLYARGWAVVGPPPSYSSVRQSVKFSQAHPDGQLAIAAVNALPGLLDRIDSLTAERDELRAGGWRDIASAPKDGTRILLWLTAGFSAPFEWKNELWMGDDFPLNMTRATHWMPLPPPPADGEG